MLWAHPSSSSSEQGNDLLQPCVERVRSLLCRRRSDGVSSVRPREEYVSACLPMRNSVHEAQDGEGFQEGLLDLTLEGLFPANQTLVVNPAKRTATLFSHTPGRKPKIVAQHQFSPNGMRVLVPLLQAYPHYCPYDVLLASLGSMSLDDARRQMQDMWEIAIRPVRRTITGLKGGLRDFGLQVRSIWSAGYLVEARSAKRV